MSELYGSGDGDEPDGSVPDAIEEADRIRETTDNRDDQGDVEDEEPLTRGEYADTMREDPAATEPDGPDDHEEPERTTEDTTGDHVEEPEPRTRQEIADETHTPASESPEGSPGPAPDVDAALDRQEGLPEPRTRQEAADEGPMVAEDASEISPDPPQATREDDLARHDDSAAEDPGPAPDERPPQEDIDRWHELYQEYRHEQEQADRGWREGTNVVGEKPDRSPGDTSDLPPTGEQLLSMEGDRESRLDRLRRTTEGPETFDDLQDSLEKNVNLAHDAFQRPEPTGSHTEVPHQPEFTAPPHQATDAGQIAVTGLVVGVLGVELFRWVHHKVSPLKGDAHASDR